MCMDLMMVLTKVYRDSHRKHTANTKQDIQYPDTTDHTRSKRRSRAPLCYMLRVCCFVVFVYLLCVGFCSVHVLCDCVFVVCFFVVVFCWCFCVSILCVQSYAVSKE